MAVDFVKQGQQELFCEDIWLDGAHVGEVMACANRRRIVYRATIFLDDNRQGPSGYVVMGTPADDRDKAISSALWLAQRAAEKQLALVERLRRGGLGEGVTNG